MRNFGLISQSALQMRVQFPEAGVNRLEHALGRVAEAKSVAELSAWQAKKAFDRIEEPLDPGEASLRENLEAAIRTETVSLNARQRLDLATEFLQVLARQRSFIKGHILIISERRS